MTPEVLVIIQARMESSRFPGKVCSNFLGQSMLLFLLDRLSRMTTPHTLVVASPDTPPNHAIADLCAKHGYACCLVPGDPNDVVTRYISVLGQYDHKTIVRVLADSPLTDPVMIDAMVRRHWHQAPPVITDRAVFQGPALTPTVRPCPAQHTGVALEWGDGLEIDIFDRAMLYTIHHEATLPSDREHVAPYAWRQPARFRTQTYPCPWDLSWLRVSIDTPEDLALVERVADHCLWRWGPSFGWHEIVFTAGHYRDIKRQMLQRPHNPAYAAQVAQEQGWPGVPEWRNLRSGR